MHWMTRGRSPSVDQPSRGQSMIEMAIVMPVLATILLGVIEVGNLLNTYINIVNLSREGSRIMLDGALNCEVRNVIMSEGNLRFGSDFTNRGTVHIARGDTNAAGAVTRFAKQSDPNHTSVPFTATSSIVNSNTVNLTGTAGVNFVVVEVHYMYPAITRFPGINNRDFSARSLMRTNQSSSTNINDTGTC